MATNKLLPEVQENMQNKKIHRQEVIQNRVNSCRDHLPLQVGQPVLVQDMLARKTQWNRGICVDRLSGRSYIIDVDGRILRRNRKQARSQGGFGGFERTPPQRIKVLHPLTWKYYGAAVQAAI